MNWHDALLIAVFLLQLRQEWRQRRWLDQVRREWSGLLRKMDGWFGVLGQWETELKVWVQNRDESPPVSP